jgi:microcystin degradation protein MlrC
MRIAVLGLTAESSAFAMGLTGLDRIRIQRGAELEAWYDFPSRLGALNDGIEWTVIMRAHAGAGPNLDPAAFDEIATEMLGALEAGGPYDGVFLHWHGAMHVDGRDDAEEWTLGRIRSIVGETAVISMSMDPHGNLSREVVEIADLLYVYRNSPHIDHDATANRALRALVETLRGERPLPAKAWVRVPILLPGERSATVVEPGATVFGTVEPAIARHGVDDAGIWVSYYWGDAPHNAGAALAMSPDPDAAGACALELAQTYWQHRNEFGITSEHSGTWAEAMAFATSGAVDGQVWVSDSGDNITGGGTGDLTVALTETLASGYAGSRILFTGLVDGDALDRAIELGVGATLSGPIGAGLDARYAPPVPGDWAILRFVEGHWGEGVTGVLLERGTVHVIVQRSRAVFARHDDVAFVPRRIMFQAFVETDGYDTVVVKNGYLFPSQVDMSATHFMALTPGGTDLDEQRIRHERIARPMHPFDRDFDPALEVVVIPPRR